MCFSIEFKFTFEWLRGEDCTLQAELGRVADKRCQTVFVPLVPFCLLSLAHICVFGPGFGELLTLMNIINGGHVTLDQSAQQKTKG